MLKKFQLTPFPGAPHPAITLSGKLGYSRQMLQIDYQLEGDIMQLRLAAQESPSQRRDRLWASTCFECFILLPDQGYIELNFSPSGHWQAYRFDAYRVLSEKKCDASLLSIDSKRSVDHYLLEVKVALPDVVVSQYGVSAVIAPELSPLSYWALAHHGQKPDFHLLSSFVL